MTLQNLHIRTPNDRTIGNYNGIDLLKFICSILVVMIHIPPYQPGGSAPVNGIVLIIQQTVCRLAVPFFFISSGFFLFRKLDLYDLKTDIIKSYCFKILRLMGLWSILLVLGGSGHLWYLGATVVAVVLLSSLLRLRIQLRYLLIIAIPLYFIGLAGDTYFRVRLFLGEIPVVRHLLAGYEYIFRGSRNGVFMGYIYVLFGAVFAHSRKKIGLKTATLGLAVSVLCLFGEHRLVTEFLSPSDYNMYVCLVPSAFFLFCFGSSLQLKGRTIYKYLRIMSVLIYFSHQIVNQFVGLGISVLQKVSGLNLKFYQFFVSLPVLIFVSWLVAWVSGKKRFRWLSYLYS